MKTNNQILLNETININDVVKEFPTFFTIHHYKKNEIIKNEKDLCEEIGIILNGEIEISTITYDDHLFTIQSLKENDIFGGYLIFSNNPFYPGYISTKKECDIAFIRKDNLMKLLSIKKEFLLFFLNYLSMQHIYLQNRMKTLNQKTIKDKIMFYLISESKKRKTNKINISSKESLAKYLNIPRPSLSRELINLKRDGLIEYNRHIIIFKKSPSLD